MFSLIGNELLVSVPARLFGMPFSQVVKAMDDCIIKLIPGLTGKSINVVGNCPSAFRMYLKRRLREVCNQLTFQ